MITARTPSATRCCRQPSPPCSARCCSSGRRGSSALTLGGRPERSFYARSRCSYTAGSSLTQLHSSAFPVTPLEDELPEELKSLPHRHSLELRHSRFSADSDAVIQAVGDIVSRRRALPFVVGAVAGIALLGSLIGFVIWRTTDRDQTVIRPIASTTATANPPAVKQPDPLFAAPQLTPTATPVAKITPSAPPGAASSGQ